MSNTSSNFEMAGVLLGKEVRKRKTPQEKIAIIQQTMGPGMTVSHVARLHGIQPSLLFKWKKQYQEGSLTAVAAGEDVVPASELAAAIKQINQLQRLLGKKSMVPTIFATLILIDVGLPKSIRRHYGHGCPRLDEFRT